jgi:hypothetical protein
MRVYDYMQCVPPPLVCPKNVYNLWLPSPFEEQPIQIPPDGYEGDDTQMAIDYPEFNVEAVKAFCNHVEILANHNEETYKYILNWVAQSIQRPAEKMGVALNFIGNQGIGKNTFINVLVQLYGGNKKKLETTQPERDVWGAFNDLMASAYLVVLSETDKRNTIGCDGKIKACITDETITINPKGKTPFTTASFHRYILGTNTEDPTPTGRSDRRNVIIRCSDELLGNKEYFTKINEVLYSQNALRSIYWTLKTMDISTFRIGDRIITEYHDEIIACNEDPIRLYMTEFCQKHTGIVEMSSTEFLRDFNMWRDATKFKFGENLNVLSLIKKISLGLRPPNDAFYGKKTRTQTLRVIHVPIMSAFLGLEPEEEIFSDETSENTCGGSF